MNLEILLKENENLVSFSDSVFVYKTYENECGEYHELEGQLIFRFPDNNVVVETKTLESDLYSLIYSVNDYEDLGFAGVTFNDELIEMRYNKIEEGELSIDIFDEKYQTTERDFFLALLTSGSVFFKKLYSIKFDNKYTMYLQIIDSLKLKSFGKYSN